MKSCSTCGVEKPLTEFYARPNGVLRAQCKTCHGAKSRQSPSAHGPVHREYQRRWRAKGGQHKMVLKRFGLTPAEYAARLEAQSGACAICGGRDARRLSVDHNHETGAVRGLLCRNCNVGIGALGDDADVLRRAAEYLEKHQ